MLGCRALCSQQRRIFFLCLEVLRRCMRRLGDRLREDRVQVRKLRPSPEIFNNKN